MILRRLRVRRFKGIADQAFTFAPGLNVISGPNESGKSTLMNALTDAGRSTTSPAAMRLAISSERICIFTFVRVSSQDHSLA